MSLPYKPSLSEWALLGGVTGALWTMLVLLAFSSVYAQAVPVWMVVGGLGGGVIAVIVMALVQEAVYPALEQLLWKTMSTVQCLHISLLLTFAAIMIVDWLPTAYYGYVTILMWGAIPGLLVGLFLNFGNPLHWVRRAYSLTQSGEMSRGVSLLLVFVMAAVGAMVGLCIGAGTSREAVDIVHPLPHHFAKYHGGISFRFAMAQDVIHERFPWHGEAYFAERNRIAKEGIREEEKKQAAGQKPSARYWSLLDDLGVGLARLHQYQESVQLMRQKFARQQKEGLEGAESYSTYANLGTFLILWQIHEGFADKDRAKQRIQESINLVHQSIEVKPDAHFGREIWQAVLEEFLLAVLDQPDLLLRYDMVGNRLDQEVDPQTRRAFVEYWMQGPSRWAARDLNEPSDFATVENRSMITAVGAEEGWATTIKTSHKAPVPFDEPALGIIGMWRYGGGANPFFALALGEIMLRVGQRYLAWNAYERAAQLAGGIGPDPITARFVEHCRKRQAVIESGLEPETVARLRPSFERELADGQAYQRAYQDYEAQQIRAGASLDDPQFYDAFFAKHGPIASRIGVEDSLMIEVYRTNFGRLTACVLLSGGLFAFLTAGLLFFSSKRSSI